MVVCPLLFGDQNIGDLDRVIQWITILGMQTIVELPEFQRRAMALLSDSEKQ